MDNNENEKLSAEELNEENLNSSQAELSVEENKVKIVSPGRMVLKRFFRSKLSVIGLVVLIVLFAFSIFGPMLPFTYGETEQDNRIAPPSIMDYQLSYTEIIASDNGALEAARLCLGSDYEAILPSDNSTVIAEKVAKNKGKLYEKYGKNVASFRREGETIYFEMSLNQGIYTLYLLERTVSLDADNKEVESFSRIVTGIVRRTSSTRILNLNAYPSSDHWLGTDASSYDIFSRLMYAGRISLTLSFLVIFIQTFLGIILGGIAGYFGKWVDQIIMRVIDILNCLPSLPIMLIFSAILDGMNIEESVRIYFLMGLLSLIGWTGTARTVRGQILMLREQEFMVAAEALGLSIPRRIIKHLIPNVMPLLIVSMTLGLGGVILSESTLSFLGLGIRAPQAAWGTMISSANDPIILQYYPNQWIPAGVMIVLVVLAFNFVGDGLRDAFDPKSRR